jgi:hypothetical protein
VLSTSEPQTDGGDHAKAAGRPPGRRNGPAWREAARQLERYFRSFGLGEPRRLDRLVADALARVPPRRAQGDVTAAALAAAEARVAAWFARVLGRDEAADPAATVLTGRAALLLCGGPVAWPEAFLHERPPRAFVAALRRGAPEPTPPPAPSAMPVQELARWSPAALVPPLLPLTRAVRAVLALCWALR